MLRNRFEGRLEIIAEIGWNFMGDLHLAQDMILAAKNSGATVAKFQYWNPDKLRQGAWHDDGRIEIYRKARLSEEKITSLIDLCNDCGIDFLVSVFNKPDAEFIRGLGAKEIKIPSHEVANFELHRYASREFDVVYASLGAGTSQEVMQAVDIYKQGSAAWVGMHCVSSYPVASDSANLPRLNFLRERCPIIGLSDHTTSIIAPAIAVALGVRVIEKHFTTDHDLPGRDNKFAMVPKDFRQMVDAIHEAEELLIDHGIEALAIESDTMTNYRGRWGSN